MSANGFEIDASGERLTQVISELNTDAPGDRRTAGICGLVCTNGDAPADLRSGRLSSKDLSRILFPALVRRAVMNTSTCKRCIMNQPVCDRRSVINLLCNLGTWQVIFSDILRSRLNFVILTFQSSFHSVLSVCLSKRAGALSTQQDGVSSTLALARQRGTEIATWALTGRREYLHAARSSPCSAKIGLYILDSSLGREAPVDLERRNCQPILEMSRCGYYLLSGRFLITVVLNRSSQSPLGIPQPVIFPFR